MDINFTIKINDISQHFNSIHIHASQMEQQLRRIKNKDISTLDERLFGNLDKVESINSTIQNLGQFQKFLLAQISQFEEKAKGQKQNKQVAQVIEQNCMTLRQSIMRVVPEMQAQRSRLKESFLSPIKGFRSTGFQKFNKCKLEQREKIDSKEEQMTTKLEQMEVFKRKMMIKFDQLKDQVESVKNQKNKLKMQLDEVSLWLGKQLQNNLKKKLDLVFDGSKKLEKQRNQLSKSNQNLLKDNQKLIKENEKLVRDNQTLVASISKLQKQMENKKTEQIQKLFESEIPIQNQQSQDMQHISSRATKRSSLRDNNCSLKLKGIQNYLEKTSSNETQCKSFMDKVKYDFTSKLTKFYQDEQKGNGQSSSANNEKFQSTCRQSKTSDLGNINKIEQKSYSFRSVDITREAESDLNVPKLLRRNSIVNQYHSSNFSQQSIGLKSSLPLQEVKANYQSIQRNHNQDKYESNQCQSTSKKSNHDLMRKTKSNFFKQPVQNKENAPNPLSQKLFCDTSMAKMKVFEGQSDGNRKRNSQSKQKLKIFSMI